MSNIISTRNAALGFASWLIPFAAAFMFYDQAGQLTIPLPLFKSIMVVIGGGVGVGLLVEAFKRIRPSVRTGLALGACWLAINLVLDVLVLVLLMGMPLLVYSYDIGLRYLLIPIFSTGMGMVAERQVRLDEARK
jgi:hypothetical protein